MTLRLPKDAGERTLLVLLLLATFLLVLEPGRVPLFEPDEGRYGEFPREMLATGDWITPRLNGVLYFEKPPLYYWSVAASMAVLGPTELAVRLPGKLSAAGMVLLAAAFARRRYGARTGLLAGLVCASSLLVVALARIAIIDPMLSLAMSGAAFAFAAFAEGDEAGDALRARRALYGFHVACAAAVLLKGLIGVVLPGGAIVFWTIWTGRWRTLARVFSPGPLLVFLALAVPWHVAMARQHPDFLQFYFVHEHFDRFAKTEHKRTGPLVYFVPVLLAGFLPWTAFLGRWKETLPGLSRAAGMARATEGFLWMFSGLVFAFFSVSRSKLIPYVLPIWPALAVLLALGIERARARGASFRGERIATGVLFGALLCAGAAYGFGALADFRYYIETIEPLTIYPTISVGFLAGPDKVSQVNAVMPLFNPGLGVKMKFGNVYGAFEFGLSGFTIPFVVFILGFDGDSKITKEAERVRIAEETAPIPVAPVAAPVAPRATP